jgi:hypothetical protein
MGKNFDDAKPFLPNSCMISFENMGFTGWIGNARLGFARRLL